MKLNPTIYFTAFLSRVSDCECDVWFHTQQGDMLNLKSELSRYVFAVLVAKPEIIFQAEILCDNKKDYSYLTNYLVE